jgi:hypothetical protein
MVAQQGQFREFDRPDQWTLWKKGRAKVPDIWAAHFLGSTASNDCSLSGLRKTLELQ